MDMEGVRPSLVAALLFLVTLVVLAASASDGADDAVAAVEVEEHPLLSDDERYMLVGMQTSGGDKIRLVVVADQRYFFITGYAKGWFLPPRWSFRDGERHRLLTTLGSNGSSSSYGGGSISSSSHAEVVASNVLAAMMNDGKA